MKRFIRAGIPTTSGLVCVAACVLGYTVSAFGSDIDERVAACLKCRAGLKTTKTACYCGGDASLCTCGANCDCPYCANNVSTKSPKPLEWALYLQKYKFAVRENVPLLIWVGETCPACEQRWNQFQHASLSEYDGADGPEYGPEVIIAKPDGLGGMDVVGRLPGIPTREQVAALLTPRVRPVVSAAAAPPLSFRPAPMMGFGGGGCGGGG